MEDEQIVALYLAREEAAVAESERKYGALCRGVIQRVLADPEDVRETLNDVWLHAWNAIPPQRPTCLRPFFAKLARNAAIDRLRRSTAQKRSAEFTLALEELAEAADGTPLPQEQVETQELEHVIRVFLSGCSRAQRDVFLRRYFYFESTAEIAERCAMRESNVLNLLSRTRKKLKKHLQEEGFLP